jgi:hypothetical protein
MAALNLRGVDNGLMAALKSEAALAGVSLREYCVSILEDRGNGDDGITAALDRAAAKKIADVSAGVVGENPACAPMGKRGLGESEAELSDEGMEILYGRTGDTSNFGAIVVPVQKKIAGKKHVPGVAVRLEKTSGGSTTLMAAKVPEATMNTLRDICAGKINNVLITPTMGADGNFEAQEIDLCWRKEYNPDTGQTGACGLEKGHKGKCGAWEVVE